MGESARSIYERAEEHWADTVARKEESHMVKHWVTSHREMLEPPKFKFKVVSSFQDSLTRQISESVRIDLRGGGILNSKTEYSRCRLPRLVIDQEEWKQMKKTEVKELEKLEEDLINENDEIHTKGLEEESETIRQEEKRRKVASKIVTKKRKLEPLVD